MLHDPNGLQQALHSQNRPTRRPWLSLLSALIDLAQGKAELLHHTERPWASATFAGTRHTVRLAFSGVAAIAASEVLIEALPEHEFNLPGQLVADASITKVEHALLPEPRMEIEVALLLLEDA